MSLCLNYLTYDPNYNYEAEDSEMSHMMDTEFEDEGAESEEYSDDDDMSWKVRRAAAKCLESVIATRSELLDDFYKKLSPALISRFKEREENVKSDIFRAYVALLKATRGESSPATIVVGADGQPQMSTPILQLREQVPDIVRSIQPLMREKSVKTRQDCFLLLRELLTVIPGALAVHVDQLVPGINFSLSDKNSSSNMRIEALSFVCCLLQSHNPLVFHPHIQLLVPLVIKSVFDSFYKIAIEALLVLQQLVKVIRPLDIQIVFDYTPYAPELYKCTLAKLQSPEVDQEVKERAIACMGQIVANMGDVLRVSKRISPALFVIGDPLELT